MIDNNSTALSGNVGGGSFLVEHGSVLQIIGIAGFSGSSPVILAHGGTFVVSTFAGDVTLQSQTLKGINEVNLKDVF